MWGLVGGYEFSPTDLTRITAAIFFTRRVRHFCAPVFMLTAGSGVAARVFRRIGYSQHMIAKQVEKIGEVDLDSLLSNSIAEGKTIEYKP
jgi:uncharacterized membrane protein